MVQLAVGRPDIRLVKVMIFFGLSVYFPDLVPEGLCYCALRHLRSIWVRQGSKSPCELLQCFNSSLRLCNILLCCVHLLLFSIVANFLDFLEKQQ